MWAVTSIVLYLMMHVLVGCEMSEVEHDEIMSEYSG